MQGMRKTVIAAAISALGLASASGAANAALSCAQLTSLTPEASTITSATLVPAGTTVNGVTPTVPFCRAQGTARPSTDSEIKFEVWLPATAAAWTGRFKQNGTGGYSGATPYARLAQDIGDGFVTAGSNMGHDGGESATWTMGHPEKVKDWGLRAHYYVATAAKALAQAYFDKPVAHSYFEGCSNGGRQAMMMAQNYPQLFDGIVAGAPSQFYPDVLFWLIHTGKVLTPVFGQPASISAAKRTLVTQRVLDKCDALDGLVDGSVDNFEACDFDPASLGPAGSEVLDAAQVTALTNVFDGPRNRFGKAWYSGWYWDPGIAATAGFISWRNWKMGAFNPTLPFPPFTPVTFNTAAAQSIGMGGASVPFLFRTPPNAPTAGGVSVTGNASGPDALMPFILSYSFDRDAPRIFARSGIYTQSAAEFMFSSSTDYRRFDAHGGKLIVYTGGADPVFSARYHVQWYQRLARLNRGFARTQEFARLFYVPGMQHCGGGIATDRFDAFASLVDWVENGKAPDRIVASVNPANPSLDDLATPIPPTRTRPLCPYPGYARYVGTGSIDDAANFQCTKPRGDRK